MISAPLMTGPMVTPFFVPQVFLRDDRILCNVNQTACQVTRVRGLQRRIGQTLTGAVRRVEVFENRQTFFKVRDNRRFDDLAGWLGHQAAHTRKLADLGCGTTRARVRHHVNRVQVAARDVRDALHHGVGHVVRAFRPDIDNLVVFFTFGDESVLVLLFEFFHFLVSGFHELFFRFGDDQVIFTE
jgi:hypothetical protein